MTGDPGASQRARRSALTIVGAPPRRTVLEREGEVAAFERAITVAQAGDGSVVLIQGSPGIGKSTLLSVAAETARERGLWVLQATASEYEREFAFGVARQLFEPPITAAGPIARRRWLGGAARNSELVFGPGVVAHPDAGELFATVHGLYWLAANLASEQPLLLCVDDVQWVDQPTRRWLGYTARRLDGVRIVMILAQRLDAGVPADDLGQPSELMTLEPAPLSIAAVGRLLVEGTHRTPSPAFVQTCAHATGGNPLLISELVRNLADDRVDPAGDQVARIPTIVPTAVAQASTARLARLSTDARAVARATAILEPRAELSSIQAMTGLTGAGLAEATDELVDAELLVPDRPLAFAHPIMAEAVRQGLAPGARSQLHLAAARTFEQAGARPELIGLHLLASDPAGDPWVVQQLLRAAAASQRIGAHQAAVGLLSRALAEPPAPGQRAEVMFALGRAQFAAHDPACVGQLRAAMAAGATADEAAAIAAILCRALVFSGAADQARSLAKSVRDGLGFEHGELALGLLALELEAAINAGNGSAADQVITSLGADGDDWRPPNDGASARELAAQVAFRLLGRAAPAARVISLARMGLPSELDLDGIVVSPAATISLVAAESYGPAERMLSLVIDRPEAAGLPAAAWAATTLAQLQLHRGALLEAEATARGALRLGDELGPLIATVAMPILIDTLIELDRVSEAHAFDRQLPDALEGLPITVYMLDASGRLALAERRWSHAQTAFSAARAVALNGDNPCPALSRWRSGLATALAAVGRREEAVTLAGEEVALARGFAAPGVLGMALRDAAMVGPAELRMPILQEALDSLARSERSLEHARTEALLGAELRRRGERIAARRHLSAALERALDLGGAAVAAVARDELTALGSRRQAQARTGRRALTASELRVARMAAGGLTNREIAQALFVTLKTVEKHLGAAYAKLGVRERGALAGVLGGPDASASPSPGPPSEAKE